jgi:tetratricopeptide (TPR) repeat protein
VCWEQFHPLLERLADLGALSRVIPGTYRIHPVLTSVLRAEAGVDDAQQGHAQFLRLLQAFCELYNFSGALLHQAYNAGQTQLAKLVALEEDNYLYVRRVALEHKWYLACLGAMQALQTIYYASGRLNDWAREVEAITPYFIKEDESPFPGRVSDWKIMMHYRAQLAAIAGNEAEVQRLQGRLIQLHDERPEKDVDDGEVHPWGPMSSPVRERSSIEANAMAHSAALNERGVILLQQRDQNCIKDFERALNICREHGYAQGTAMALLNLGNAFSVIDGCRDLTRAERCFEEALASVDSGGSSFARSDHFADGVGSLFRTA